MIRHYKIGDKVQYDAPNSTSSQHVHFVGIVTKYGSPCMSCADGTQSYHIETQYGPRIVCETVLHRIDEQSKPSAAASAQIAKGESNDHESEDHE